MLAKIATLAKSKAAIAVLGVVLVGGGSSAVAVAATTGHLSTLGVDLNSAGKSSSADSHAHTVGVEGLLVACNTTTTPNTISVKDKDGKSWTFVVSSTTKFNGAVHTEGSGSTGANAGGASTAKGDNSAKAGGASTAKGSNSANAGGASTNHTAATLADICATANLNTRDVQVQATPNGSAYDAWKVTLQGQGSANGGSSTDSNGGDSSVQGTDTKDSTTPTTTGN